MTRHARGRRFLACAGALAFSLAISGCGGSTAPAPAKVQQTLQFSLPKTIETLDPAQWVDRGSQFPMQAIYDTLLEYGRNDAALHPALATYTVSPDGLQYTFTLRKGVKFSNGDPVTAQDVIFSLNRVTQGNATGQGPSPYGFAYSDIVGYGAWYNGGNPPSAGMTGMSGLASPRSGVVTITLKEPQAYFPQELALMSAAIMDRSVVEKYGSTYQQHAVGTGPYKLQQWTSGKRMVLVANPDSWRGNPKVRQITIDTAVPYSTALSRYREGKYDFVWGPLPSDVYSQVQNSTTLKPQYVEVPSNGIVYLALNTTKPPFGDPRVRQAANFAINKPTLIQDATQGRAGIMTQPLPSGIPGYDPSIHGAYPYDQSRAKALLQEAGYKGQPLTLIYPQGSADREKAVGIIQQQLEGAGFNVTVVGLNATDYWASEDNPKGDWNLAWSEWSADYPDAQDVLQNLLGKGSFGATNVGNWTDPTFEGDIEKADALPASEQAQRVALYQAAERIAVQQAAWVFLYTQWRGALVQPWVQPQGTPVDRMLYVHPEKTPQFGAMSVRPH